MSKTIVPLSLALCALLSMSCSGKAELGEAEAGAINTILKTGVSFERDPYVRAETFRVIELVADPALADYAREGLDDSAPMVRLASLRATLASDAADSSTAAARVFARGSAAERRVVLDAVAEYDEGPGRRELLGRALRSQEPTLRRVAFEASVIERIDQAVAANNTKLLERTLFPELGRYVALDGDPILTSLAVEKFLEQGQKDRIAPLTKALTDPDKDLDKRLNAARILMMAGAEPARSDFNAILARYDEMMTDQSLGVPDEVVPPELRRLAVLGSVATGDTTHIKKAQAYANNANVEETIEVLEALGRNPSEDAAITLKIAMQDARREVRLRAIELYQDRDDVDPTALIRALKGADFETQERIASVLLERFPEEWLAALRSQLQRTTEVGPTLALLRNIVSTSEEAEKLIVPLEDLLQQLAEDPKESRAALASYFLAITSVDEETSRSAMASLDAPTRYAYLEFLVRTKPEPHVDTFRQYLYDDMYVMRLMSAAGLWRVLGGGATPERAEAP